MDNKSKRIACMGAAVSVIAASAAIIEKHKNKKYIPGEPHTDADADAERGYYINSLLYDEMPLVVGKNIPTGSFAKSFADFDVETEIDSTPLQDEVEFEVSNAKDTSASSVTSTQKRPHRKRKCNSNSDDERIEKLAMAVKEVAMAIRDMNKDQLLVSHLYAEVMKTEGFDEISLATIFDYLVQNEMLAKAFMAKSAILRNVWIQNFISQHGGGSTF